MPSKNFEAGCVNSWYSQQKLKANFILRKKSFKSDPANWKGHARAFMDQLEMAVCAAIYIRHLAGDSLLLPQREEKMK